MTVLIDEGWLKGLEKKYPAAPSEGITGSGAAALAVRCGVTVHDIDDYATQGAAVDAPLHLLYRGLCTSALLRPVLAEEGNVGGQEHLTAVSEPVKKSTEKKKKKRKKKKDDKKEKKAGEGEESGGEHPASSAGTPQTTPAAAALAMSPASPLPIHRRQLAIQENLAKLCSATITSLTTVKTARAKKIVFTSLDQHRPSSTCDAYGQTLAMLHSAVVLASSSFPQAKDVISTASAIKVAVQTVLEDVWTQFRSALLLSHAHPCLFDCCHEAVAIRQKFFFIGGVSQSTSGQLGGAALLLSQAVSDAVKHADTTTALICRETIHSQLDYLKHTALADVAKNAWKSYSAFYMNRSCTHGVSFAFLHIKKMISNGLHPVLVKEVLGRLVTAFVSTYTDITPSAARSQQLRADSFHICRETRALREMYSDTAGDPVSGAHEVDVALCDLLLLGVVLSGGLAAVVNDFRAAFRERGGGGGGAALPTPLWEPPQYLATPGTFNVFECCSVAAGPQGISHEELMKTELPISALLNKVSLSDAVMAEILSKRWELWDESPQIAEEDKGAVIDLKALIHCVEMGDMSHWDAVRVKHEPAEPPAPSPAAVPSEVEATSPPATTEMEASSEANPQDADVAPDHEDLPPQEEPVQLPE